MPARGAVDNYRELFALRLYGRVTKQDVLDGMTSVAQQLSYGGNYSALVLFDPPCDLSELDAAALKELIQASTVIHRRLNLERRASVAMVADSYEAQVVMSLYNVLWELAGGLNINFKLFPEVTVALAWLDIPEEAGRSVIAQT